MTGDESFHASTRPYQQSYPNPLGEQSYGSSYTPDVPVPRWVTQDQKAPILCWEPHSHMFRVVDPGEMVDPRQQSTNATLYV